MLVLNSWLFACLQIYLNLTAQWTVVADLDNKWWPLFTSFFFNFSSITQSSNPLNRCLDPSNKVFWLKWSAEVKLSCLDLTEMNINGKVEINETKDFVYSCLIYPTVTKTFSNWSNGFKSLYEVKYLQKLPDHLKGLKMNYFLQLWVSYNHTYTEWSFSAP